jgi:hypothetical protein
VTSAGVLLAPWVVTSAGVLLSVGVLLARVRPGAAILRLEGIPKPARVLALLRVLTTA